EASSPAVENTAGRSEPLTIFCAAGLRYPLDQIVDNYTETYGRPVSVQYGGSNTMLSQLAVGKNADLYIAADDSYTQLAEERSMVRERFPLASQRPVIVVRKQDPPDITTVNDLPAKHIRYAIGDPEATAVGKKTKQALEKTGIWQSVINGATVIKPTVNEIASAVSLGSIDAGVVWDSTAVQYPELQVVQDPQLEIDPAKIEAAVTEYTDQPAAALHFARFLASADRGLPVFSERGFNVVAGDRWAERPQLTFYVGAVNRRAIENAVNQFAEREGVTVNTVYNGCGILTAQMRSMIANNPGEFPDSFMACDTFYMRKVDDLFLDAVNISDTDIVIVVKKGNPKNISGLSDLIRPGVRVALGQPRQCTIGVLSKNLLAAEGIYDTLQQSGNLVAETTSSALLLPNIITGAADVVLAYRSDAEALNDEIETMTIDSELARAVQAYGIAKNSNSKRLSARLFDSISEAKADFLKQGFGWQLTEGDRPSIRDPQSRATNPATNIDASP
ncbi:MAG: molybdate ABC transporter substrate-binding protein, partial [Planctomycetota bacterium]|nr:molybdate ABC transporter substrate-binding protein [Planctomycetota bacterium]